MTAKPLPHKSLTMAHLKEIECKLASAVGDTLEVEYYPDKPSNYRLIHPNGALLLSYAKSSYSQNEDINVVIAERELTYTVTIVGRELHSPYGTTPLVDWVVAILSGFKPTHCTKPLRPVDDRFEDHVRGLWYHAVDVQTQGVHLQDETYNPRTEF